VTDVHKQGIDATCQADEIITAIWDIVKCSKSGRKWGRKENARCDGRTVLASKYASIRYVGSIHALW